MNVLEFAAQGLRGFSSAVRLPLRGGVNVITPSAGDEPAPIGAVLAALFYSDGRGGDAAFAQPGQKARAAVMFSGRDGATYRLLRELGGAGGLQRQVGAKTETISKDAAEIAQFLRAQAGFPSQKVFESLCVLSAAQRPAKVAAAPKAKESGPSLAAANQVTAAADVGAAQAKLGELERELALSNELEQLQYEQDGLASQAFEVEQRLQNVSLVREQLAAAERAVAQAPTIESLQLPADILERVERHPQATTRREEALARLEQDRAEAAETAITHVEPLARDPRFWGALALGVAFFGCGIALTGSAKYLALLDLPAFGVAAALAFKYVDELQNVSKSGRREDRSAARLKKIEDDYQAEVSVIHQALKTLGLERVEEIADVLGRRPALSERLTLVREQLAELERDPETARAASELAAVRERQESLNEQLLTKGGYVRDVREVEREIERTRESIALALEAAKGVKPEGEAPGESEEGASYVDPCPSLLSLASELQLSDVATLAAQCRDRCLQYFAALTDRRYTKLDFASATGACTVETAKGESKACGALPKADLDWLFLSLRLTIAERVLAPAKLPVLVDDGFAGYDPARFVLLARMLKHLGTLTQVAVVTRHPSLVPIADNQVAG